MRSGIGREDAVAWLAPPQNDDETREERQSGRCMIENQIMFEGIRSLLGAGPKRSETDEKLDEALASANALDHYFFFSDQSEVDQAVQRLQERGWTLESVSLNAEVQKWQLQVRQPGPIESPQALKDLQTELDLLADELHGQYDGWQVPGVTEHL